MCQITSIFLIGEISKSLEGHLKKVKKAWEKITGKKLVGDQQIINEKLLTGCKSTRCSRIFLSPSYTSTNSIDTELEVQKHKSFIPRDTHRVFVPKLVWIG